MINKLNIKNHTIKFIKKYDLLKWEEYNDDDFFFNERDSSIDLNNVIYQIIQWENQIINICNDCQKNTNDLKENNEIIENQIIWK
jgi:hypothetical protein